MTLDISHRILALIDRLAPPRAGESMELRRRGRLLAGAALVGVVILAANTVSGLALGTGMRMALANLAWCAVFVGLLVVLRRRRALEFVANGLVGIAFLHTFLLSALSAGGNIGALFAFCIYPLLSVLLAGWRSGLVFTVLSTTAIIVTPLFPTDFMAPIYHDGVAQSAVLVRDSLNLTIAIGLFSAMYDVARNRTLRDAQEARADAETSEARVRRTLDAQAQLLDLARRFQDATGAAFDQELDRAVRATAEIAGADRAVLRLLEGERFVARHLFSSDGLEKGLETTDEGGASRRFQWSVENISSGQLINVASLDELPREAEAERAFLEQRGVQAWLCTSVRAGRRAVGYLSLERTHEARAWSEQELSSLSLMTELIASAVLRERIENALRESEEKFAMAFRDHPDAMVISDLETDVVIECNTQWLHEVAIVERHECIGRKLWDFGFSFPDEQRELMRQMLCEAGHTPAIETSITGRLGDERTYLVSAKRIEVDGRPCVLANAHDLTEYKRLEQQLLHSQKMEAVGRLAGGIAHDFNNMLTVISGYSSRLEDQLEGELQAEAKEIRAAARRSAALTRQLLAFSRRQVLRIESVAPGELLRGLEKMLRPLIGESIELVLDTNDEVGRVRADRGQLEQAIVNLALNARDAMPTGGTLKLSANRIEVTSDAGRDAFPPELSDGAYVILRVEDDGEGMHPEIAAQVMEPFYTTKPEGKGTGLGLAMVHGIARQSEGALRLESEPGSGTCAEIFLPVENEALSIAAPAPPAARPSRSSSSHVVLLAEDEPTVRRLALRALRAAGYEVFEAEDGAAALTLANELGERLDMLVSDIVMPNMSGIALTAQLREQRPELPILLMSGYPDPAGQGQPIPEDVDFVLKPFVPSELCDRVERALSLEKANEAAG